MLKKTILSLMAILLPLTAFCNHNGLQFNSHSFAPTKRTTLLLNNGEGITVSKLFEMSFLMDLRDEAPFGNIFCIKTDDGHHIDAMFSISGKTVGLPTIAIDGKLHHINNIVSAGKNIPVAITIDRKEGTIRFSYAKHETVIKADIKDCTKATIAFGMHTDESNYYDVAPINVRNISISSNNKREYYWPLSSHDGDISQDSISGCSAKAINGQWIYDKHVEWKQLLSFQSNEDLQVAYNEKDNRFYIVDKKKVRVFDPETKKTTCIDVKGGRRIINTANFLIYDSTDGTLLSYGTENPQISKFNFNTATWSFTDDAVIEPTHSNHAWALANDSISYVIGGYGFYRYRDNLYRINHRSGSITEIDYKPRITPRTGCAATIVDNKMYVFGGYGNKEGKQELPGEYLYDLICIDLSTGKAKTLWEGKGEQNTSFQLASEMYYDKRKNVFYAATSNEGGRIIRISPDNPHWDFVTGEMNARFEFKEMAFDLYQNTDVNKFFIVINKTRNDNVRHVIISSIDLPLQDDYVPPFMRANADESSSPRVLYLALGAILLLAIAFIVWRRRPVKTEEAKAVKPLDEKPQDGATPSEAATTIPDVPTSAETATIKPSQITLLGKFAVTDKDGNDITSSFSKRLRDLLLILTLYTQKDNKGIEMHEIDDSLWQNMSEVSARNNRNVNISKLRMLLEKVGEAEILNDKIYYRINLGNDVHCDYARAMKYMARINDGHKDETTIAKTLELLLKGPLVPNVSYEWLDPFKAQYSESALALLSSLLYRAERDHNDSLALKIAETIMQHDPFNEKALSVLCSIHCHNNRTGIAKKIYDNFCKVYEHSMGEPFDRPFMDVCK